MQLQNLSFTYEELSALDLNSLLSSIPPSSPSFPSVWEEGEVLFWLEPEEEEEEEEEEYEWEWMKWVSHLDGEDSDVLEY